METYFSDYPPLKFYLQSSLGNIFHNHRAIWKTFFMELSLYLWEFWSTPADVTAGLSQLDFDSGTIFYLYNQGKGLTFSIRTLIPSSTY